MDEPVFEAAGLAASAAIWIPNPNSFFDRATADVATGARALPRSDAPPSISNLTIVQPAPPLLTRDEEAWLIYSAQCFDSRTSINGVIPNLEARKLVLGHLPYIQTEARKRWCKLNRNSGYGRPDGERCVELDDFVAASVEGWWTAVVRFAGGYGESWWRDGQALNKLNAFARLYISKAISDTAFQWRNRPGLQMDSRIQRHIRKHPDASVAEISEEFKKYTPWDIFWEKQQAKDVLFADRYAEDAVDDEADGDDEKVGTATRVPPVDQLAVSSWSLNAAGSAEQTARLNAVWEWHCRDLERRAQRRSRSMGRRAYAEWLVNRKTTCPPPENETPGPYKPRRRIDVTMERIRALDEGTRLGRKRAA
jgi:hypothetical protein